MLYNRPINVMYLFFGVKRLIQQLGLLLLLVNSCEIYAINDIILDLGQVQSQHWQLQNIKLQLSGLNETNQGFAVAIEKLVLPEPLAGLSLVQVTCEHFQIDPPLLACKKGHAKLVSPWLTAPNMLFDFTIREKSSELSIHRISIASGSISIKVVFTDQQWHILIIAKHVDPKQLADLLAVPEVEINSGLIDFQVEMQGQQQRVNEVDVQVFLKQLSLQSKNTHYAAEALEAMVVLHASQKKNKWQWHSKVDLLKGAIYAKPVFLELNSLSEGPIQLSAKGNWVTEKKQLNVLQFEYQHPGILTLQGQGDLFQQGVNLLADAEIRVESKNLDSFYQIYLLPNFAAGVLQDLSVKGNLHARLKVHNQQLNQVQINIQSLAVNDVHNQITLSGGSGHLNWTDDVNNKSLSDFSWKKLNLLGVPFDPAYIKLYTDGHGVVLAEPVVLPLLEGSLDIKRFDYRFDPTQEPEIHFAGTIKQLSLDKLTLALELLPLSGTISGEIPGVNLKAGKLSLDGGLLISLFDGQIRINELAASGLFSVFPQFNADLEIINLDLNQLTKTFSLGFMEGRLSGQISDLYMEDWEAVTFYAWLGTPDDDDSRHRISQKAVQNIASIGGGSVTDLFSRGFLRFFETFAYQKLGMGCYLYQGVCQLWGVQAVGEGYYIVKGGGLPRINVIGYNPRLDWNVLLESLKRLGKADQVVIE